MNEFDSVKEGENDEATAIPDSPVFPKKLVEILNAARGSTAKVWSMELLERTNVLDPWNSIKVILDEARSRELELEILLESGKLKKRKKVKNTGPCKEEVQLVKFQDEVLHLLANQLNVSLLRYDYRREAGGDDAVFYIKMVLNNRFGDKVETFMPKFLRRAR